jgi:hypothetical protein
MCQGPIAIRPVPPVLPFGRPRARDNTFAQFAHPGHCCKMRSFESLRGADREGFDTIVQMQVAGASPRSPPRAARGDSLSTMRRVAPRWWLITRLWFTSEQDRGGGPHVAPISVGQPWAPCVCLQVLMHARKDKWDLGNCPWREVRTASAVLLGLGARRYPQDSCSGCSRPSHSLLQESKHALAQLRLSALVPIRVPQTPRCPPLLGRHRPQAKSGGGRAATRPQPSACQCSPRCCCSRCPTCRTTSRRRSLRRTRVRRARCARCACSACLPPTLCLPALNRGHTHAHDLHSGCPACALAVALIHSWSALLPCPCLMPIAVTVSAGWYHLKHSPGLSEGLYAYKALLALITAVRIAPGPGR